jgi:hypothetical protein
MPVAPFLNLIEAAITGRALSRSSKFAPGCVEWEIAQWNIYLLEQIRQIVAVGHANNFIAIQFEDAKDGQAVALACAPYWAKHARGARKGPSYRDLLARLKRVENFTA